jgi:hypothetical protein
MIDTDFKAAARAAFELPAGVTAVSGQPADAVGVDGVSHDAWPSAAMFFPVLIERSECTFLLANQDVDL